MSESQNIQIYEVQAINKGVWEADRVHPWTNANMEDSASWDEYRLPAGDWIWAGNWKIEKEAGRTDKDGWEYASKYERWGLKGRRPKPEKLWNDKSRRRLWIRTMRREAGGQGGRTVSTGGGRNNVFVNDIIEKVKNGLATIHKARMKIEQTMANNPDSVSAEKRTKLIMSVSRNVEDISNMLALAEQKQSSSGSSNRTAISMLSKLRRDCEKEKEAIENAFSRNSSRVAQKDTAVEDTEQNFTRLTMNNKAHSLNFTPSITITPPNPSTGPPGPASAPSTNTGSREGGVGGTVFGMSPKLTRGAPVRPPVASSSASSGSTKQQVHSGKGAGTFSLDRIVAQNDCDGALDGKDGHYMSEALQRKLIEKKLVSKDEATVMQEIIDERSDAIEEIYTGLVEVNKMFRDLSEMVKDNEPQIEDICKNISDSHDLTRKGYNDIVDANRLQIEGGACTIS